MMFQGYFKYSLSMPKWYTMEHIACRLSGKASSNVSLFLYMNYIYTFMCNKIGWQDQKYRFYLNYLNVSFLFSILTYTVRL